MSNSNHIIFSQSSIIDINFSFSILGIYRVDFNYVCRTVKKAIHAHSQKETNIKNIHIIVFDRSKVTQVRSLIS